MELRPLGSTGLSVSPIGLGLAALGRPGYLNLGHGDDLDDRRTPQMLRGHAEDVLDAAYRAGIRYFDVARSYGLGEEFLGHWLRRTGVPAGGVGVGSKWGYEYTAGWQVDAPVHEVKDHSLAMLERQAPESRRLLGAHLGLYQIHSATLETGVLDDAAVLQALGAMKESGVAVGLSTSGPNQAATVRRAIEVRIDGAPLFSTVQATWNLLEPSAGPALSEAVSAGLAVIVKEAVANGRLTDRNQKLPPPLERLEASPDAVAIAAALAQPWVTVVLSGAATEAQLLSNLGALELDGDVVSGLVEVAESPAVYWATRSDMAWT